MAKTASGKRNKKWNRDELILALDLYFRARPKNLDDTDPRVVALSKTLNGLPRLNLLLTPPSSEIQTALP